MGVSRTTQLHSPPPPLPPPMKPRSVLGPARRQSPAVPLRRSRAGVDPGAPDPGPGRRHAVPLAGRTGLSGSRRPGGPAASRRSPDVTVGMMGLTGPSGVLPRYYSEIVTQTLRARSAELHDFMDLLAHRFVAFFAVAAPSIVRPGPPRPHPCAAPNARTPSPRSSSR